jgi:hypothetical protein
MHVSAPRRPDLSWGNDKNCDACPAQHAACHACPSPSLSVSVPQPQPLVAFGGPDGLPEARDWPSGAAAKAQGSARKPQQQKHKGQPESTRVRPKSAAAKAQGSARKPPRSRHRDRKCPPLVVQGGWQSETLSYQFRWPPSPQFRKTCPPGRRCRGPCDALALRAGYV